MQATLVIGFAAMIIPLKPDHWIPTKLNDRSLPTFQIENTQLEMVTKNSAGGYVYLFDETNANSNTPLSVSWDWRVETFPQNSNWEKITKANDDSPIRIGVLVSDGSNKRISVPNSLKGALGKYEGKLSHIIFYSAAPGNAGFKQFQMSPYSDQILYCFVPASTTYSNHKVNPIRDFEISFKPRDGIAANVKIIGLWIFADSDNSRSSSTAYLKNLSATHDAAK